MANPIFKILRRLTGAAGAPENLGEGILAYSKVDSKLYVGTDNPAAPEVIGGKGEFVDLGSEQTVSGKKNFTSATVSTAPVDDNDVVRKSDLAAVASNVAALGSALNYVGTVNGGADAGSATDLSALTEKDAGDYYKVGTSGHFALGATTLFANSGDGLVFNLDGGIDKIDNTNSTVSGTANEIAVSGSTDTGFTVAIDSAFSSRVSTLETTASGLGTMATQDADSVTISGGSIDGTSVGATTASTGAFTTLTASSTATLNTLASSCATLTGGTIDNMIIGGTTAVAGSFTTVTASGDVTFNGNIVGDGSTQITDCIIDAGTF